MSQRAASRGVDRGEGSTCDGRRRPGGSCRGADTSAADGADAGAATTNFDAIGGVAALPGFGRRYCGDIAGVAATGDGGTSCSVGATTGGGGDGASGGDAGGGALDGARVEEEEERARRRLDHRLHLELRLPGGRRAVDAVDVRERQHAVALRRAAVDHARHLDAAAVERHRAAEGGLVDRHGAGGPRRRLGARARHRRQRRVGGPGGKALGRGVAS